MAGSDQDGGSSRAGKFRRMLADSFYAAFGTYATHFFSLLISVVLTRRLDRETYGVYSVLLSLYMVLTLLFSLGAQPVIQRYLPELDVRGNRRGVIRLTLYGALTHLFAGLVIALVCWFGRSWLADFYNIPAGQFAGVMPFFILFTILKWEASILEETLTAHRSQQYRNIVLSLFQAAKWVLFLFLLPQDGSIQTVMFYLAVSNLFLFLAFAGRVTQLSLRVPARTSEELPVRRIARYGLLRYMSQATIIGFFTDIDVQLISHFHDPEQAGLYGFATKTVQMVASLVPIYFMLTVITPVYIREYTERKDPGQLIRVFGFYNKLVTAFLAPTLIGALLLTEPIIAHVWDPKFLPSALAFKIFFIGSFIHYFYNTSSFLSVILEKPEFTLYSRVFVIYNIAMDLLLIPRYGIVGAAIATGSALALGYIFMFMLIRRVIPIRIPWAATGRTFFYTGVMAAVVWPLRGMIDGLSTLLLVVLAGVIIYGLLAWRMPVFNEEERERLNTAFGRPVFPTRSAEVKPVSETYHEPEGRLSRLAKQVWPLIALAFVLRLLATLIAQPIPYSDAAGYWESGIRLAQGGAYADPYHPIGYALFVSGVVRAFGPSLLALALVQALMACASVYFVFDIGRQTINRIAGWFAALLFALYAAHIYYSTLAMTEVFFSFLLLLSAWLAYRPWGLWRWLLVGVALGCAAITKPFVLYFPFFALPFLLLVARWRRPANFAAVGLVLVTLFATVAPRFVQTARLYGAPVLGTNSSFNLLIANNPTSDGRGGGRPWVDSDESPLAGVEDPIERARIARSWAIDYAVHHPKRTAIRMVKAGLGILSPERLIRYYHRNDCHAGMPDWLYYTFSVLIALSFPVALLLALPGLFRRSTLGENTLWIGLIVFFLALHILGFGQARFRLPLAGFFLLFAGKALVMEGGWLSLLGKTGGKGLTGLAALRAHRMTWLLSALSAPIFIAFWILKTLR